MRRLLPFAVSMACAATLVAQPRLTLDYPATAAREPVPRTFDPAVLQNDDASTARTAQAPGYETDSCHDR